MIGIAMKVFGPVDARSAAQLENCVAASGELARERAASTQTFFGAHSAQRRIE